jgi:DNA-binding NarL/FixJ family response regulator
VITFSVPQRGRQHQLNGVGSYLNSDARRLLLMRGGSMAVTRYTELFSEQDWTRLKEDLGLPPRQAEVLRGVLRGMGDKQVACATGISINTVRSHMNRLFARFGSNDRVELILCMIGHLRQYHSPDDPVPASGTSVPEAVRPSTRKHHR